MNRIQDIVNQLNDKERMEKIYKENQRNRERIIARVMKEEAERQRKAEIRLKRKKARIRWQNRKESK